MKILSIKNTLFRKAPSPSTGEGWGEGDTIGKYIIWKVSLDHPPPNPLPSMEGGK